MKVLVSGFIHKGNYIEYANPIEFNAVTLADGDFLLDPDLGYIVAKKINGEYYLKASIYDYLTFDHRLVITPPADSKDEGE